MPDAIDAYFAALSADGGALSIRALEGSDVDVALQSLVRLARLPRRALALLGGTLSTMGQRRLGRFLRGLGAKSVGELWRITAELRAHRAGIERTLRDAGVDVLIFFFVRRTRRQRSRTGPRATSCSPARRRSSGTSPSSRRASSR